LPISSSLTLPGYKEAELAATLRGSRPGVQSASLYDNSGKLSQYDVIDDIVTRKL